MVPCRDIDGRLTPLLRMEQDVGILGTYISGQCPYASGHSSITLMALQYNTIQVNWEKHIFTGLINSIETSLFAC